MNSKGIRGFRRGAMQDNGRNRCCTREQLWWRQSSYDGTNSVSGAFVLAMDGSQEGGGPRTRLMHWTNHARIHPNTPPPQKSNCSVAACASGN